MLIPEATIAELPPHLSVLSCGAGDLKFSFDSDDPKDVARAQRCVEDMLKRGYQILVEVDGKLVRCTEFDKTKNEYIIRERVKGKGGRKKGVPAKSHRAHGVAPTAGG